MKIKPPLLTLGLLIIAGLLSACTVTSLAPEPTARPTRDSADTASQSHKDLDIEITTLLPKDAIPSIDNPQFYDVAAANGEYDPDELVMGVSINGEKRAYSTSFLSGHEIVNDVVGGEPIAVTW